MLGDKGLMAAISLSTVCLSTAVREANVIPFDSSIQKGIRMESPYSNNFNRDTALYAHASGDTVAGHSAHARTQHRDNCPNAK